jgi:hypothetical protein
MNMDRKKITININIINGAEKQRRKKNGVKKQQTSAIIHDIYTVFFPFYATLTYKQ